MIESTRSVHAQALKNGYQEELPGIWLTNGNPKNGNP